jgi:hypothetical protein
MDYKCKNILDEKFIISFIEKDKILLDKYKKFKLKLEIINDSNKKFCPHPNCDSYGEKDKKNKYITCKNGHQFCFVCLKKWHGDKKCDVDDEENFQIWKKNKIIKQCPKCKIYTEKNEGCNHMTCVECKFQWCWLCSQQYEYDHFKKGKCNGLQFFKPVNEEEIEKVLKDPLSTKRTGVYNYGYNYNNNINRNRNRNINPPAPRVDHSKNVLRYKKPSGLVPIGYYDTYNDIDNNNPFNFMQEHVKFGHKVFYVILYIFFTPLFFIIAQFNRFFYEIEENLGECYYGFNVVFRMITAFIISVIYFIPYLYCQFLIFILILLYFPILETVKVVWYLKVLYNIGINRI